MSLIFPSILGKDITARGGVVDTIETLVIGATFSLSPLRVDTNATGLGDAAAENHIDLDLWSRSSTLISISAGVILDEPVV